MQQRAKEATAGKPSTGTMQTNLFIGGQWRPASDGGTFPVIDPATEAEEPPALRQPARDLADRVALLEHERHQVGDLGEGLDDPVVRLKYYMSVWDRNVAVCAA